MESNKISLIKESSYQLFVAGHCNATAMTPENIKQVFSKECIGNVQVEMPYQVWKGFCFIIVSNQTDHTHLIKKASITVSGNLLAIKSHKKGNQLFATKKDIHNRKLFVRILSKTPIKIDLKAHFSIYGPVESAYVIEDHQKYKDANYTMIGYVLFFDKEPASMLLEMKKIIFGSYEFIIKRLQDKELKKVQDKGKNKIHTNNTQMNNTPVNMINKEKEMINLKGQHEKKKKNQVEALFHSISPLNPKYFQVREYMEFSYYHSSIRCYQTYSKDLEQSVHQNLLNYVQREENSNNY